MIAYMTSQAKAANKCINVDVPLRCASFHTSYAGVIRNRVQMNIHEENFADINTIWNINADAFETEANLVNALRDNGCTFISLVAETDNIIVGHILFTPVELTGNKNKLKIWVWHLWLYCINIKTKALVQN